MYHTVHIFSIIMRCSLSESYSIHQYHRLRESTCHSVFRYYNIHALATALSAILNRVQRLFWNCDSSYISFVYRYIQIFMMTSSIYHADFSIL